MFFQLYHKDCGFCSNLDFIVYKIRNRYTDSHTHTHINIHTRAIYHVGTAERFNVLYEKLLYTQEEINDKLSNG